MANNLIMTVVVTCGRDSCGKCWTTYGKINLCPHCGWESDGATFLITEKLREEGLEVNV